MKGVLYGNRRDECVAAEVTGRLHRTHPHKHGNKPWAHLNSSRDSSSTSSSPVRFQNSALTLLQENETTRKENPRSFLTSPLNY